MKPYGRLKNIKGLVWKKDYHIILNNKKLRNWWEDFSEPVSNKTARLKYNEELAKQWPFVDYWWQTYPKDLEELLCYDDNYTIKDWEVIEKYIIN